ncbi:type II restriction endonuclease [Microcystis aeruginosa BLCCF158]|uniref:Type II restriction endonuclease n=1 Tax=Microcystis aeruginosa BLCC-F158 TaxID=2755316 RepID=A0A841UZV1_MICAE|nr:type II restriction endonuclease [Microcystis aeruginosa]MBC1196022.1 type II restriction endonuclease [Microcystis aeruginosa BLCC-F158]
MKTENFSPRQALNKAFLRVKPNLCQVEKFQVFLHTKTMIEEFNLLENGRDNPKNSC